MAKISIIGGGLAGLITAINLKKNGIDCQVIEKKTYPFHRVCGEYISNEVIPFLKSLDIYPDELQLPSFNQLQLTSVNGSNALLNLDLGGFGISRFTFDQYLYEYAKSIGIPFQLNTSVTDIRFKNDQFTMTLDGKTTEVSEIVVGAFGKRSKLDSALQRSFFMKRSPYIGVKYHIHYDPHPNNVISLHNFQGGYCGISRIEDGKYNLCYLSERKNLTQHGDIETMQQHVLYENPYLKEIFENATFIFDKPKVINEISFETKKPVENHILMCGDAAGMITPLCGNGMAMAIQSSKILAEFITKYHRSKTYNRTDLEKDFTISWQNKFSKRLWVGRQIQRLFGSANTSNLAVNIAKHTKPIANFLVRQTHGEVMEKHNTSL